MSAAAPAGRISRRAFAGPRPSPGRVPVPPIRPTERTWRVSFLLRVVLPDKPGSLGAVATALGNAGADILGVDVVERGDGQAIDDLAVELPAGRPPDVLITAAESVPGVAGRVGPPALRAAGHAPRAGADRRDHRRTRRRAWRCSPTGCRGSSGPAGRWSRSARTARSYRLAESAAAPETRAGDLPWLPLDVGRGAGPERALGARSRGARWTPSWPPRRSGPDAAEGAGRGAARRAGLPPVRAGAPGAPGRDRGDRPERVSQGR